MTVYAALTEEECYLWSILSDESGLDQAEFCYIDETNRDTEGLFRAWPFQHPWWRCEDQLQIDQAARSVGKSLSIKLRTLAFPLNHPQEEMVLTAPQGVHLDAVTDNVETMFLNNRLARELLAPGRTRIKHRTFLVNFKNGARIIGRIPQHNGTGIKGTHPLWLEQDESQDWPQAAWGEIIETFKGQNEKGRWRCIAEGQMVFTARGFVPIEDVVVGDEVWTHKNRWRKVTEVWDNGIQPCIELKGNGIDSLIITDKHKMLLRSKPLKGGQFSNPEWVIPQDIVFDHRHYWASPSWFGTDSSAPAMEKGKSRNWIQNTSDLDWLWLYGLYLAEGYGANYFASDRNHYRSHWCVNDSECDLVADKLRKFGLKPQFYRQGPHSVKVYVYGMAIHDWLVANAGKLAHNKFVANWVFALPRAQRQAIFDGMTYGDGHWASDRSRWDYCSHSKKLALGIKLLGQSLGYVCNIRHKEAREAIIEGRRVWCKEGWSVQMTHHTDFKNPHSAWEVDHVWSPLKTIEPAGLHHTYDLTVEEDHSYTVNGIVVSNCHGVTRGVGDGFDERCKPDSGWTVHRLPAMYRPNWTEEERQQKIMEYGGSVDSVDYRRNVLGLKGDSTSPIFVNFRLMLAVDVDHNSHFNLNEYAGLSIDEAEVRDVGDIAQLLELPGTHRVYKRFWIGMDVGWTIAPTSIVIFAEDPEFKKGKTTLKLLARILMKRVATQDQVAAIIHLIDTYRPQAFALDSTGAGFPLFQSVQEEARKHPQLKAIVDRIKGYNFSGKVIAEFDDSIKIDEAKPDSYLEAAIMRNVLEHSTDVLRGMVDRKEVLFPYDQSIISEFLGQTWQYAKDAKDAYGRKRIYSEGAYHTLDACRMAILAYQQQPIEDFIKSRDDGWEPPDMVFL